MTTGESPKLEDRMFFQIEKVVSHLKVDSKKLSVTREGNAGQIQKIGVSDKTLSHPLSQGRSKYSFYGPFLSFDLAILPNKII